MNRRINLKFTLADTAKSQAIAELSQGTKIHSIVLLSNAKVVLDSKYIAIEVSEDSKADIVSPTMGNVLLYDVFRTSVLTSGAHNHNTYRIYSLFDIPLESPNIYVWVHNNSGNALEAKVQIIYKDD